MTPTDILQTAERAAASGDRTLFIASLIVIAACVAFLFRYFIGQVKELSEANRVASSQYRDELKTIVAGQNDVIRGQNEVIRENTRATAAQTESLRANSEVMRIATKHLERLEMIETQREKHERA